MKKSFLIPFLPILCSTLVAMGATTEITLLPSDVGGTASGIGGTQGSFAPGFDSGSWNFQSGGDTKAEVYITPSALFSGAVTVGDISSISYWTNKPTTTNNVDWYFNIYTQKTGISDGGSFYHSRLVSEPYFSPNGATYTPNAWTQWNSNPTTGLRVYDTFRNGGGAGAYTDPFLNAAFNGPITYATNNNTVDYTGETVKYFSLQTALDWSAGFPGLMDGLTITLKNGDIGIVNFEAVPEPTTWLAAGLVAAALASSALRRVRRA